MAEIALAAEIAVLEMIPDRMRDLANVENFCSITCGSDDHCCLTP
jgi:hypothetical protein